MGGPPYDAWCTVGAWVVCVEINKGRFNVNYDFIRTQHIRAQIISL